MALGTLEEQSLWDEGRGRAGAAHAQSPSLTTRNECPQGRMASQSTRQSFLFNPLQEDRRLAKCVLQKAEH